MTSAAQKPNSAFTPDLTLNEALAAASELADEIAEAIEGDTLLIDAEWDGEEIRAKVTDETVDADLPGCTGTLGIYDLEAVAHAITGIAQSDRRAWFLAQLE